MKKYSVLLSILALVIASLACQTVMGGGGSGLNVPNATEAPQSSGGAPTLPPVTTDGGNITVGGKSEFPTTSDATNVVSAPGVLSFQTKMSADDVMKFYRVELTKQGFAEKKEMTTSVGGTIAMFFEGNGKTIVLGAGPTGNGSLSVNLAFKQ